MGVPETLQTVREVLPSGRGSGSGILKRTVLTCNEGKPEVVTLTQSGNFWLMYCIVLNGHFKMNMLCLMSMGHCEALFKKTAVMCQNFW